MFDERLMFHAGGMGKPMIMSFQPKRAPVTPVALSFADNFTISTSGAGSCTIELTDELGNKTRRTLNASSPSFSFVFPYPIAVGDVSKTYTLKVWGRPDVFTMAMSYSYVNGFHYKVPVACNLTEWGDFSPKQFSTDQLYWGNTTNGNEAFPEDGTIALVFPKRTTSLKGFFKNCLKLPANMLSLDMSFVTDATELFYGAKMGAYGDLSTSPNRILFDVDYAPENIMGTAMYQTLKPVDMTSAYESSEVPTTFPFDFQRVKTMKAAFKNAQLSFVESTTWSMTSAPVLESMESLFEGCTAPYKPWTYMTCPWPVLNVKTMKAAFKNCPVMWLFGVYTTPNGVPQMQDEVAAPNLLTTESMYEGNYISMPWGEASLGSKGLYAPNNKSVKAMFKGTSINVYISDRGYDLPYKGWTFAGVEDFSEIFMNNYWFNQTCTGWSTFSGKNFSSSFENAIRFRSNCPPLRVATNISKMFKNAFALYDSNLNHWSGGPLSISLYSGTFTIPTSSILQYIDLRPVQNAEEAFYIEYSSATKNLFINYGVNFARPTPDANGSMQYDCTYSFMRDKYKPCRNFTLGGFGAGSTKLSSLVNGKRMFAIAHGSSTPDQVLQSYINNTGSEDGLAIVYDGCIPLTNDLDFDMPNLANGAEMFRGCLFRKPSYFAGKSWNSITTASGMFSYCMFARANSTDPIANTIYRLPSMPLLQDASFMYMGSSISRCETEGFATPNLTNTSGTYAFCALTKYPSDYAMLGETINYADKARLWNTSKVTDMSYMYAGASSSWDLSADDQNVFTPNDTSKVTNFRGMFSMSYLSSYATNWEAMNVSSATDMSFMFCFGSLSIYDNGIDRPAGSYIFSNWRTPNLLTAESMFHSHSPSTGYMGYLVDVAAWFTGVTPALTNVKNMFNSTTLLPFLSTNTFSAVTNASGLFRGTTFNDETLAARAPIGALLWPKLVNASYMFAGPTYGVGPALPINFSGWRFPEVLDASYMFFNRLSPYPGLSQLTLPKAETLEGMFALVEPVTSAATADFGVSNWNVSSVKNFSKMFQNNTYFNQVLNWDVGNATDISYMFAGSNFNQDLTSWYTRSLLNMEGLFSNNKVFNRPVNFFDTSKVTSLKQVFLNAIAFNQPVNLWNTISVTNMSETFRGAAVFNQAINTWNVQNVTDMSFLFAGATAFNQPLSSWNVSKVTNMGSLFREATTFNQPLTGWNTANVTDMSFIFGAATNFTQSIAHFNTSKVTTLRQALCFTPQNFDVSGWDVSKVTDFTSCFQGNRTFNRALNLWNTSSATSMAGMFNTTSFNQDISMWNTSNVIDFSYMFYDSSYTGAFTNWSTAKAESMEGMFGSGVETSSRVIGSVTGFNTAKVTNFTNMFIRLAGFNQNISGWNVGAGQIFSGMFAFCRAFSQPIGGWNVANATNMSYMFHASGFNQAIGSWNVGKVTNFTHMFSFNGSFAQDISNWNVAAGTTFTGMFTCTFNTNDYAKPANPQTLLNNWGPKMLNAVTVNAMFQNTKHFHNMSWATWNVSKVTDFGYMFCDGPTPSSVANWNTVSATMMNDMFRGTAFNAPLSHFTMNNVINIDRMFFGAASFNQPIGNWNVSKVQSANTFLYNGAAENTTSYPAFNQDLSAWRPTALKSAVQMFMNCGNWVVNAGGSGDLTNWNLSNLLDSTYMFCNCAKFNSGSVSWNLGKLQVSNAMFAYCIAYTGTNMDYWRPISLLRTVSMFYGCWNLTGYTNLLQLWGPTCMNKVTDASNMFMGCNKFNATMTGFKFNACTNMTNMFYQCTAFNQNLTGWCVPLITAAPSGFSTSSGLAAGNLPRWGTCPA